MIKVIAINVDRKANGTNIAAASDTIQGNAMTIRHHAALKIYKMISASNTSLKIRVKSFPIDSDYFKQV